MGTGAAALILQLLLAGVAAFGAGALVQRILLGEYGITLGPVSLPALPPISGDAAAKAVDLIKSSPEFTELLPPGPRGPQPHPQYTEIEDERLALISIRTELEARLRALAQALDMDRDIAIERLPSRLVNRGVIDQAAARGLDQLLSIGDSIAAGAEIEPEAATNLQEQAGDVLYAIGELRRRAEEGEWS